MGEGPAHVTLPAHLTRAVGRSGASPNTHSPPALAETTLGGSIRTWALSPVESSPDRCPGSPQPTGRRALTRHVGGRKLLTLETLHTPSRHCWAWMVTVLRAPPRPAGATDTWTLGPDGQAGPFLLSGPARPDCLPVGPASAGPSLRLGAVLGPGGARLGPPWGASGSSRLAGAWSSCRASRVSWVRRVAQTSQRRSASGRHAGSLSRSRAERQGSWGNKRWRRSGSRRQDPPPSAHAHSSHRTVRN